MGTPNKLSITIGIPTYQGYSTLESTIESIITAISNMSEFTIEIVICVNGELRETLLAAEKCKEKYPDLIQIAVNKDKGKAKAINTIVSLSSADVIVLLDDDIILKEDCLLKCYEFLIHHPEVKLVSGHRQVLEAKPMGIYNRTLYQAFTLRYRVQLYLQPEEYILGGCMAIRRIDFPGLPEHIINDDQFLHILFWGKVHRIYEAIFFVSGINSIKQYHFRYYRIKYGREQINEYFSKEQVDLYNSLIARNHDYLAIVNLSLFDKVLFLTWKAIDFSARAGYLFWGKKYSNWSRNTYDHQ